MRSMSGAAPKAAETIGARGTTFAGVAVGGRLVVLALVVPVDAATSPSCRG